LLSLEVQGQLQGEGGGEVNIYGGKCGCGAELTTGDGDGLCASCRESRPRIIGIPVSLTPPPPAETPTPRTDEKTFNILPIGDKYSTDYCPDGSGRFVLADLARQLERELAAANLKLNDVSHARAVCTAAGLRVIETSCEGCARRESDTSDWCDSEDCVRRADDYYRAKEVAK
jgi:hypothetical protein